MTSVAVHSLSATASFGQAQAGKERSNVRPDLVWIRQHHSHALPSPLIPPLAVAPSPADAPTRLRPPAAGPDLNPDEPAVVSVMCPAGFTAYSADGLTLDQPLFARVTYRRR
jgi:hypothetical protein